MQAIKFTKKLFILTLSLAVTLIFLYCVLFYAGYYPVITNSPSLDAKLLELKTHQFHDVDVLSIGSSMNLNNLSSNEIKLPKGLTYYNLGAWGLQISDTLYLVKYFANAYKPQCVIVSSSVTDFSEKDLISMPTYSELGLINTFLPYFYSKSNLFSIASRHREITEYKAASDFYTNLNFDKFGGMALNIPKEKISVDRWNAKLTIPSDSMEYQYAKLRELTLYLKSKNIIFIFAQSPIKKVLVDSDNSNTIVKSHFIKCQSIINDNGGHYINLHNPYIFVDSLFVDQYHLTSAGSDIYTRPISVKINELLKK